MYIHLLIDPLLAHWLILFDFEMYMNFCILICFNDSPCYNINYYNNNSVWPSYIVIYFTDKYMMQQKQDKPRHYLVHISYRTACLSSAILDPDRPALIGGIKRLLPVNVKSCRSMEMIALNTGSSTMWHYMAIWCLPVCHGAAYTASSQSKLYPDIHEDWS